MALNFEQFQALRSQGLSVEQIRSFEQGNNPGQPALSQPEERKGVLSKVGGFISDVFKGATKPVVQSVSAPFQAIKASGQANNTEANDTYQNTFKQITKDLQNPNISEHTKSLLADSLKKLTAQQQKMNEGGTQSVDVNVPYYGKIEPAKTMEEAVGRGAETAALGLGPVAGGAAFAGGQAMTENQGVGGVAANAVGGAVLGKAGEVGAKVAGKVLGKAGAALKTAGLGSEAISDAAAANYSRVLSPTTKANKIIAQKIAPEMAERKITALTRKGIMNQAEQGLSESGQKLTEAYAALPQDAKVVISPILGRIGKEKSALMMKDAEGNMFIPKANESKMAIWQNMQDELMKLSSEGNASVDSVRAYRQLLDSGTYAKGVLTGSESVQKEVERKGADIIRGELANQFPDIAKINKDFTFWSNVRKVTQSAIERKTGQAKTSLGGKVAAGAGAVVGGSSGGPIGAIEGAKIFQWMHSLATSPAWETLSGSSKAKLADFLSKGETTKAGALMLLMAEKAGVALEKTGAVIGGIPQATRDIPKMNVSDIAKEAVEKTKNLKPGLTITDVSTPAQKRAASIKAQKEMVTKTQIADFEKDISKREAPQNIAKQKWNDAVGIARSYAKFEDLKKRFPKAKEGTLKKLWLESRKANR